MECKKHNPPPLIDKVRKISKNRVNSGVLKAFLILGKFSGELYFYFSLSFQEIHLHASYYLHFKYFPVTYCKEKMFTLNYNVAFSPLFFPLPFV